MSRKAPSTPTDLLELPLEVRERPATYLVLVDSDDRWLPWLSDARKDRLKRGMYRAARGAEARGRFEREVAAKVAYLRRLRLAFAVSLLCGTPPAGPRLARWRDVDLEGRRLSVPKAHIFPANRLLRLQGNRCPDPRAGPVKVYEITEDAAQAFQEARTIGDGVRLLCDIEQGLGQDRQVKKKRQKAPPWPKRADLVFPGDKGGPLPEHVFRYKLMDPLKAVIKEIPGAA